MYCIKIIALLIFAEYWCGSSDAEINATECNICLSKIINDDQFQLPCRHVFHEECIIPWLASYSSTCPTCRAQFPHHIESRVLFIENSLVKSQQTQTEALRNAQLGRNKLLANAQKMLNLALDAQVKHFFSIALKDGQNIKNESMLRLIEADDLLEKAVQDAKCALDEATDHAKRVRNEGKAHIKQGRAFLLCARGAELVLTLQLVSALENAKHFITQTTKSAANFLNEMSENSKRIRNEAQERAKELIGRGGQATANRLPLEYAKETAERIRTETTATAERIRTETMANAERIQNDTLANAHQLYALLYALEKMHCA
uniref:RING-type domain-containing protein n=1 Tax=Globodera rostochiensis TaxID=31243 RepID=A0A914HTL4_GLORO